MSCLLQKKDSKTVHLNKCLALLVLTELYHSLATIQQLKKINELTVETPSNIIEHHATSTATCRRSPIESRIHVGEEGAVDEVVEGEEETTIVEPLEDGVRRTTT